MSTRVIPSIWFCKVDQRTGDSVLHLLRSLRVGVSQGGGPVLEAEAECWESAEGEIDVRPERWDRECQKCLEGRK